MGQEGDYEEVDKAWSETGRWAKEVAAFRHAKIQSIRLAGDPNAPVLPEHMTLDQLRESIILFLQIALTFRRRQELDKPSLVLSLTTNSKLSSAILAERKFWVASSRATSEIGKSIRPSTKIFSERLRRKPALGSFL
jgi:hypothetical protein